MGNYLETIYFEEEYEANQYPQHLCNYIVKNIFEKNGEVKGKKLLDIGSGKGNHLVGFIRNGIEVSGMDKREECITVLNDIEIEPCDIEKDKYPFNDNSFDFVYSKSVLEHVTNTDNFVKEALRVLKPGGIAVFLTPDWRSQRNFFWDDYTHVKAFTRKSLQNALRINGYKNVDCSYFYQLPILWKFPWLKPAINFIALFPDALKWKDKEESKPRKFIRFSKEKMLLAIGEKEK
jgi:2-polyprenyl-3-methyl-5-hydroxy-6-metoxy-1,4-benzoquinol methylase